MSSMKAFLSPSHFVLAGPERCLDASTLSFFREERQRAKTASPVEREEWKEEEEGGQQGRRKEKRGKGVRRGKEETKQGITINLTSEL